MVMDIVQFLELIVIGLIIIVIARGYYQYRKDTAELRKHRSTKKSLMDSGVVEDVEAPHPQESARKNFAFMGIPQVDAGQMLYNIPEYDPKQKGSWETNQVVLTAFRVIVYTRNGPDPLDAVELSGGYFLASCAGRAFIMNNVALSMRDADLLQAERQSCDETNGADNMIESFSGYRWKITGEYGKNRNPKPGERDCSFLQVLSAHPDLGKPGFRSVLPPKLMNQAEHKYFDLRARRLDDSGQPDGIIMFAFYSGAKWNLLIGRELQDSEINRLQAI